MAQIKFWDGTAWVKPKAIYYWDGTSWKQVVGRYWDGVAWVDFITYATVWHCDAHTNRVYELSAAGLSVIRWAASPGDFPAGIGEMLTGFGIVMLTCTVSTNSTPRVLVQSDGRHRWTHSQLELGAMQTQFGAAAMPRTAFTNSTPQTLAPSDMQHRRAQDHME